MLEPILEDTELSMGDATEALQRDIARIRTGRASSALVEEIPVEYYGSQLPLNQVATIIVPEPRLIVIQPWDKQAIPEIERAIQKSELGITPNNDGTVIRIALPQPTAERRQELAKMVRQRAEEARVAIRNSRRSAQDELRKQQKSSSVSEDDVRRAQADLQKLTDAEIERVDKVLAEKEEEILTI
jgi:ribosome recycling factor